MPEQIMLIVDSIFKGITLNKKRRLDPESLRYPETRMLRYHGYKHATLLALAGSKRKRKNTLIS